MRPSWQDDLETLKQRARARFGANALTTLGILAAKNAIPTGFADLDATLGTGGLPIGNATEIIGQPTSGAATLALKIVAAAQQAGNYAAYLDLQHALNAVYAARHRVSLDDLLIIHPASLTQALDICVDLLNSKLIGLIVLDRLSLEHQPTTAQMQRLNGVLAKSHTALLVLTSAEPPQGVGSLASIRLRVTRRDWLRHGEDIHGYQTQVAVLHNKFAPPAPPVTLNLSHGSSEA